jgi:hypothetical protein
MLPRPDPLRVDVLIGVGRFQDRRDMDAALVGEGGMAGVGLVIVVLQVGDFGDEARQTGQLAQAFVRQHRMAHLQLQIGQEGDQIGIADPLAVAVDGALHHRRAGTHRRQRIGHRAAAVVVAVHAEPHIREARHHRAGDGLHLPGQLAAVGFAQHQPVGPRLRRSAQGRQGILRIGQEAVVEVLGVEHHFPALPFDPGHTVANHRQVLFRRGHEHMRGVVVPGLADQGHRRGAGVDQGAQVGVVLATGVGMAGAAEGGQPRRQVHAVGTREEIRVLGVGTGPAAFDVMHAERRQAMRDGQLVFDGKGDVFALRAVAQRGVIEQDRGHGRERSSGTAPSTFPGHGGEFQGYRKTPRPGDLPACLVSNREMSEGQVKSQAELLAGPPGVTGCIADRDGLEHFQSPAAICRAIHGAVHVGIQAAHHALEPGHQPLGIAIARAIDQEGG